MFSGISTEQYWSFTMIACSFAYCKVRWTRPGNKASYYRIATCSLTDHQEQTNKFSGSYIILMYVHEIKNICI